MDSCPHRPDGSSPTRIAALGLIALGLLIGVPALATPKLQTFHIEAGDATLTLNEFSRQSSLQLLFDYNVVRGRKTHAVSGELEAQAALVQMLVDTDLVFDFVNDRTLAVTLNHPGAAGSAVAEAPSPGPARTRTTEAQSVARRAAGTGHLLEDPKVPVLEEIRILGTHVRGGEPVGEHVVHLEREDINSSPAGTVQDLLRTLPQTFGGGPTEDTHFFSAETRTNSGLGSGINLRGLGARSTLVLINGKRLAPSGSEAQFADIENIPLSAVERMDILPDGASALYGADAVGGVVNFVMRDNFTGAETLVRGGSGIASTLEEYRVAQTFGTRWDSGNGMVSLEFYKRGALPSYAHRYTASDLTALGGSNFDTSLSNPGTLSVNGQTYAIPAGQNGTGLNANNLVPGTRNLSDWYDSSDILPSQRRWSFYGSARENLKDSVAVYGNAMISRREAKQLTGGFRADLTVTPLNPFYVNPTGGTDPVTVGYNFLNDIGPTRTDVTVNNVNITLGLDVAVGSAWRMNLYANYARETENQLTDGLVDFVALNDALMDTDPATAFNPFGDGSHTNPATLKSIATSSRFHTNSKLRTADVTADGPIGHLAGGDIKLALGVDRRNQVFRTLEPANGNSPLIHSDNSRNVTAAFGEIRVPVFGPANGRRGLRQLEISVAARYEHYSDFGHAATPKLGLAWTPLAGVAFRGTWGRSIRAPTLADLDASQNVVVPYVLPDRSSSAGVARVLIESGKNPNLTVEHARAWTVGFDIDARDWVSGLTFSATWFNIRFRDRIEVPPPFDMSVLNDPSFASLITHNPSAALVSSVCSTGMYTGGTSSDCLQYGADAILDIRSQNRQSLNTRGIDVNSTLARSWSPGTLKLRLDGTYLLDFTQQNGPDTPPQQLLNTQNNPINIKLRGLLSWQQRRWAAALGVNFQNHYQDLGSDPHRNIGSYTTFDTQLRYDLSSDRTGFLQNTLLELNAVNVFNVSPPFLNNRIAQLGYDQENADPYGRLLSLQVRKSW